MANSEIRQQIKNNNIERWMIAEVLKISEADFLRLLQDELPPAGKAMVAAALDKLQATKGSAAK